MERLILLLCLLMPTLAHAAQWAGFYQKDRTTFRAGVIQDRVSPGSLAVWDFVSPDNNEWVTYALNGTNLWRLDSRRGDWEPVARIKAGTEMTVRFDKRGTEVVETCSFTDFHTVSGTHITKTFNFPTWPESYGTAAAYGWSPFNRVVAFGQWWQTTLGPDAERLQPFSVPALTDSNGYGPELIGTPLRFLVRR